MAVNIVTNWGRKIRQPSSISPVNSNVAFSAGIFMRAIGILTFTVIAGHLMVASAYAEEKCSAKVAAILNDPEAKKPPKFSGNWTAYECFSCETSREDFRAYKFVIEQKDGKVTLKRDLYDLKFGPVKVVGRTIAVRNVSGTVDKEGGDATMKIEISPDGTTFKGTVEYVTIVPGRKEIHGRLNDKDVAAKRRLLSEKKRNLSGRAVTLALQCLKKFEAQADASAAQKPAAPAATAAPVSKPSSSGIEDSLRKLKQLLDKKLITPEEYRVRRQKFLDKI